jgi:hypothetical protein
MRSTMNPENASMYHMPFPVTDVVPITAGIPIHNEKTRIMVLPTIPK